MQPSLERRFRLQVLPLIFLAGCSNTSLTESWQSPALKRSAMDNVLVVAVTANSTSRILFERGFVQALNDKGIQATASYDVIGVDMPTREAVTNYVKESEIRYIVATRYGSMEVTKERVPESVRTYYTGPYYGGYAGFWAYGNTVTTVRDSYVDQTTTVVLTTSVFEADSEALVWVGRSKSFEIDALSYAASDLARLMVGSIED